MFDVFGAFSARVSLGQNPIVSLEASDLTLHSQSCHFLFGCCSQCVPNATDSLLFPYTHTYTL